MTNSELILNPDGSIFHLHLFPEEIADTIILVGDPDRVSLVSSYFSKVTVKRQSREFVTHTGVFNGKDITVLSTGIGTDNIDIVVNELDALANIDIKTNTLKTTLKSLNLIRIGTSGALQADIPVGTPLVSKIALGFDGLLNFYQDVNKINDKVGEDAFMKFVNWNERLAKPYLVESDEKLFSKLLKLPNSRYGINISAPGFYGPQGRVLRLPIIDANINDKISQFSYNGLKITNYEMECSAIYGLSKLLGHNATTVCSIIANRLRKEADSNYKETMKKLVENTLNIVMSQQL